MSVLDVDPAAAGARAGSSGRSASACRRPARRGSRRAAGPLSTTVTASASGQVGVAGAGSACRCPRRPSGWGGRCAAGAGCPGARRRAPPGPAVRSRTEASRPSRVELDPDQAVVERRAVARCHGAAPAPAAVPRGARPRRRGDLARPTADAGRQAPVTDLGRAVRARRCSTAGRRPPAPASAGERGRDDLLQLRRAPARTSPRASRCTQAIELPGRMSWNWCSSTVFQSRSSSLVRVGVARRVHRGRRRPQLGLAQQVLAAPVARLGAGLAWCRWPRCSSRYSSPDQTGASGYSARGRGEELVGVLDRRPVGEPSRSRSRRARLQHLAGGAAAAVAVAERGQRAGAAPFSA